MNGDASSPNTGDDEYLLADRVQVASELGLVDAVVMEYASADDDTVVINLKFIETSDQVLSRVCDLQRDEINPRVPVAIEFAGGFQIVGRLGRGASGRRDVYFERPAELPTEHVTKDD